VPVALSIHITCSDNSMDVMGPSELVN
jgi:hypothetical protein